MKQISYSTILKKIEPTSYLSYINNRVATYIVYKSQNLPLTPNIISTISLLFSLFASISLLVFDNKVLFATLSILTYTFDNVDGIWARTKHQTSAFGGFYDGFLDSGKLFIVDISFILYYFERLQSVLRDPKLLVLFFSTYFILWNFYSLSSIKDHSDKHRKETSLYLAQLTNGAMRYIVIFPLMTLSATMFLYYLTASYTLFILKIVLFFRRRYYASKQNGHRGKFENISK